MIMTPDTMSFRVMCSRGRERLRCDVTDHEEGSQRMAVFVRRLPATVATVGPVHTVSPPPASPFAHRHQR